jgi:hypothetical protein
MRKIFILLMIVGLSITARAQENLIPCDTLIWREGRPLKISDFKGEPIESSNLMGEAFCMILTSYEFSYDSVDNRISAVAVFDNTNSWISSRVRKVEISLLFQVTFNLFEVNARKLRKVGRDLRFDPDAEKIFHRKYISTLSALNYQCNELKRDTRMGADKCKLQEWDKKIKKELKDLEENSSTAEK